MASVRFENVSISYGAKQVVKDFSLSVNDGEIMGIIGPSGCGKTTLIRALCGLIKPEKGNIYINDQLVFSDEKRINVAPERRGIGVVFQDYAVWPHLSVWDNVCYPMKKHKVPKEKIAKRAAYALEQVRMTGYEKHMPAQLSGGQQQRVAIARSLVSSDELIVLDEPITNLDAKLREEMILEIQMIQQNIGTTIIYITHDQEAALQLCDRIAIMQPDGQICQIGSDEEIIRLFFERSEQAIEELVQAHGSAAARVARNILGSERDAEECLNDTYLAVWNAIPPQEPAPLRTFVCKIARNLAAAKYHANTAKKRNSRYDAALDELEDCLAAGGSVEEAYDAKELSEAINAFLSSLSYTDRFLFVRRYWYSDSMQDIAAMIGSTANSVAVRLYRLREKLRHYLIREGLLV